MDKINYKIEDNKLHLGADTNQDGENAVDVKVHLTEALGEAFNKGEAVDGVQTATVKFMGTKLQVIVDTDQDGEALLDINLDIGEILDEAGVFN
jgi:hypothetical protein